MSRGPSFPSWDGTTTYCTPASVTMTAFAGNAPSANANVTRPPLTRTEPGLTFLKRTVPYADVVFLNVNDPSISSIVRVYRPRRSIVPPLYILPVNSYSDRVELSCNVPPLSSMSNGTVPEPSFGSQTTRSPAFVVSLTTTSDGRMMNDCPADTTTVASSGTYDSSSKTTCEPKSAKASLFPDMSFVTTFDPAMARRGLLNTSETPEEDEDDPGMSRRVISLLK